MAILARTAPTRLLAAYGQSQIVATMTAIAAPKLTTRNDPLVRPIAAHPDSVSTGQHRQSLSSGHHTCPMPGARSDRSTDPVQYRCQWPAAATHVEGRDLHRP